MYLTIGTHFCGGEAVETKILFGETHLGCEMPDMAETCDIPGESCDVSHGHLAQDIYFDKVTCCENVYQTFQVTNEFVNDVTPPFLHVNVAVAFIYTTLNLDLFSKSTPQFYTEYNPPPLEKDLLILFQTFLI
jgi:hypothetical protein